MSLTSERFEELNTSFLGMQELTIEEHQILHEFSKPMSSELNCDVGFGRAAVLRRLPFLQNFLQK